MRLFHISDVLSVTTGRLVSSRHMDGVYDILNFLTGDNLFTHQLPRASRECKPCLRAQFPYLMKDHPPVAKLLQGMDDYFAAFPDDREVAVQSFVEAIRRESKFPEILPEMLPVYELGADMYTHIDPVDELEAMGGNKRVIVAIAEEPRP